jgi:hypothetical protein
VPGVSSADVFSSVAASAYIEVPAGSHEVPTGTTMRFEWMPGATEERVAESAAGEGST